jgi:type VI secretion system secreted protein VgrG
MSEAISQEARLMSVSVTGQDPNTFMLQGFSGTEAISRPFSFQLELKSTHPAMDFTQIIGNTAIVTLKTRTESKPRYLNGYVARFAQSGSDLQYFHYHMEIVPWIWFLTRHADCRIFHNLTIPEIIQKVFEGFTAKTKGPVRADLQGSYSKQEYTVQYRETSLSFISRLMEHAGIYYYFEHDKNHHTMVLTDNSASASECPIQSSASHMVRTSGEMTEDIVASIHARREFKTGMYTSTDYNFETPSANMVAKETTVMSVGGNDPLEMFDYPGIHGSADEGRDISKIRMQEHEASHHTLRGSGNVRGFIPGFTFSLKEHPRKDMNDSYLLTELRHSATVGGSYQTGPGGTDAYSNQFTCIPASIPYRPPRVTPKPLIYGVQPAVVIGKAADTEDSGASDDGATGDGEEIWVDKYGRIIVRFPWDRAGACSCRVRVAQQWAGVKWGGIVIPRVGQEVLVSFLDGDPDRPIVIGCVYNAHQKVPYDLPENQTRSTFKTHSSKGGGDDNYNELRFEDKKGEEQVFIRGEKDLDTRIKNDSREWIGNNQSAIVKKDRMGKVEGDDHLDITGNLNQKAGQNISIQAGQNLYSKSGTNYAHEAGTAIHIKAGTTMVLEAGAQLSLKVGGNFIDIGPAGVTIFGTMVMINSGGSAGSGGGSSPTSPTAPDEADDGNKGTKM